MICDKWLHIYSNKLGTGVNCEWVDDVRENVKGEWIEVLRDTYGGGHFPYSKCSVCQSEQIMDSNFCPNCGADMRGES